MKNLLNVFIKNEFLQILNIQAILKNLDNYLKTKCYLILKNSTRTRLSSWY